LAPDHIRIFYFYAVMEAFNNHLRKQPLEVRWMNSCQLLHNTLPLRKQAIYHNLLSICY